MNVFEFIREKKSGIKDNTEQYRAILEPKFRSLSNKITAVTFEAGVIALDF